MSISSMFSKISQKILSREWCQIGVLPSELSYKQAEPTSALQKEDTPKNKICVGKLKINRPKISFNFFKKNRFWWVEALERGGMGVRKKRPKDALREKIDL